MIQQQSVLIAAIWLWWVQLHAVPASVFGFHVSAPCTTVSTTSRERRGILLAPLGSCASHNTNEFCRTVPPDKILKLATRNRHQAPSSSQSLQQQYTVDIEASEEECQALAKRFDLPNIASLGASLSLAPEQQQQPRASKGIWVRGTGYATVTRVCVRSNEPFESNLEFAIDCLARPVEGIMMPGSGCDSNNNSGTSSSTQVKLKRSTHNNNKSKRQDDKDTYEYYLEQEEDGDVQEGIDDEDDSASTIDAAELRKLQSIMDDGNNNNDATVLDDAIMEDDNIYTTRGTLDVGELLAQLFWLDLDPYPRKPGSEFLQFSITG